MDESPINRRDRAILALYDHGSRDGATSASVKSAMLAEGFTFKEMEEAARALITPSPDQGD